MKVKTVIISFLALIQGVVVYGQSNMLVYPKGKLVYENTFNSSESVKGWVMEGPGTVKVQDGWMELFSKDKEYHHVYWCPEDFPGNFVAEWEAQNLDKDGGLIIMFFSAKGINGEDVFDPSLPTRDGTFRNYTKVALNCYHTSYYTDNPETPERELAHLRKNEGFNLVFQGPEGIPKDSEAIHKLTLVKDEGHIQLFIDGREVINWKDDGKTYGKVLGGGKMGFRQMKWSHFRYRNFRVWQLED
jgi:hypothetical protein